MKIYDPPWGKYPRIILGQRPHYYLASHICPWLYVKVGLTTPHKSDNLGRVRGSVAFYASFGRGK